MRLSTRIHDRDGSGLTYVYPVVSRRAGGVSVGINLNTNNACNWRCVYCQVPGLVLGTPTPVDLARLEEELRDMLDAIVTGDFMEKRVPADARRLNDVAFSGNGEPTSSPQFREAVEVAGKVLGDLGLLRDVKLVLITNGSLVHKPEVRAGIERMRGLNGEVWFKLDSATEEGRLRINDERAGRERMETNLRAAAAACPTWLQTIALARGGEPPSEAEQEAYLALLDELRSDDVPIRGVLLYGLARQSHQPEAPELAALPREWMEAWAERIRARGLEVKLSI
ncbi:MAG: radical SAM protein [Planctomycetota bacterium]|nr:radical SAM protein [Planctomycetota bacterium]